MSVDTSPLGHAAAHLMDQIAEEFGEGAQLEAAGVIVDVSYLDEENEDCTAVRWRFVGRDERGLSGAHARGIASILNEALGPE